MSIQTITEAIAELKTIDARIGKKREFIGSCLARQEQFRDPHEKDGGSRNVILREFQSINDLQERSIRLRSAIQLANRENKITIGPHTRTINDWLVWRREIAQGQKEHFNRIRSTINDLRKQAQAKGWSFNNPTEQPKPQDVIVNINESQLAADIEDIETILGTLDGQLSLKNATITVDVE